MKKMLLAVVLLGFGFMVGCGDDKPAPKTGGSASGAGTTTTVTHSSASGSK